MKLDETSHDSCFVVRLLECLADAGLSESRLRNKTLDTSQCFDCLVPVGSALLVIEYDTILCQAIRSFFCTVLL